MSNNDFNIENDEPIEVIEIDEVINPDGSTVNYKNDTNSTHTHIHIDSNSPLHLKLLGALISILVLIPCLLLSAGIVLIAFIFIGVVMIFTPILKLISRKK